MLIDFSSLSQGKVCTFAQTLFSKMASAKASIEKSLNVLSVPRETCTTALELNSNTALSGANHLPQLIFRTTEKVLEKALLNSLKAQSALHKAM